MDLAGLIVESVDPALHTKIAGALRTFLSRNGMDPAAMGVAYVVDARLPSGIALRVTGGVADDVYLFHAADFPNLGGHVAEATGHTVCLLARERRAGQYEAYRFGPSGRRESSRVNESPSGWLSAGKRVGASLNDLEAVLEQLVCGSEIQATLADAPDGKLLTPHLNAMAKDPRTRFPGRRATKVFLPEVVASEIEAVAKRTHVDAGTVYWAAWEWAKPHSYAAFRGEDGKKCRSPRSAPPPGLTPGLDTETPMEELVGERRPMDLWVPPKLAQQIEDLTELCDRGPTWVFMQAYVLSRPKLLGARSS